MRRPRNLFFHVAPRYTAGSPAQVDEETATKVAIQEYIEAGHVEQGVFGEEQQATHARRGCRGIAFTTYEKNRTMWVQDIITQELFAVPLKEWGGPGWINWHDKMPEDMEKYLYTRDDADMYRLNLYKLWIKVTTE